MDKLHLNLLKYNAQGIFIPWKKKNFFIPSQSWHHCNWIKGTFIHKAHLCPISSSKFLLKHCYSNLLKHECKERWLYSRIVTLKLWTGKPKQNNILIINSSNLFCHVPMSMRLLKTLFWEDINPKANILWFLSRISSIVEINAGHGSQNPWEIQSLFSLISFTRSFFTKS